VSGVNPEFTPSPNPAPTDEELIRQREELRRGLRRANFAWVVIVAVIAVLAIGVVWKAGQSAREAERANHHANQAAQEAKRANAETDRAEAELWNARFTEARALRTAGGPGARVKSSRIVAELARAAGITETQRLALRAEAIAQLALVDVDMPADWGTHRISGSPIWDSTLKRFAAAYGTNDVGVFEFPSEKLLTSLKVPAGFIRKDALFSADGRYLAGLFNHDSPRVLAWRLEDGCLVVSNRTSSPGGHERPFFSPDGRWLAIYTSRYLELHSLATNAPPRRFPKPVSASFSPDSRRLAALLRTNVEIWAVENGEVRARCAPGFVPYAAAWHPNGKGVALGGSGGGLASWEQLDERGATQAGSLRRFNGHFGRVVELSYSPDGSLLLSFAWGDFSTLWDVQSGRRLLVDTRAALKQFSADGAQFAVEATRRLIRTTVPFLGRTGFRAVAQAGLAPGAAGGVAFSPDGRFMATDHIESSCLWDSSTGRELARVTGRSPLFLPDNQGLLTCTERGVFRFDLPSAWTASGTSNRIDGAEILHRNRADYPNEAFNSLALAPDGRTLVICANDSGVVLFDLVAARITRRFTNAIADYASISADGNWLVTQVNNGPAYLVPVTNTTSPAYLGMHFNTAFSPDGNRLALATGEALSLLERNVSNRWVRTRRVPVDLGLNAVASMAFTSDSKALAVTVNRFDIRLLDPADGRELATLTAPFDTPIEGGRSLEFSPDGRFLRALRQGGEVIEWDIPVVRAELAKLGLDWGKATRAPALAHEVMESGNAAVKSGDRAMDSPLTPALSPLRGEGVALEARGKNRIGRRAPVSENDDYSPHLARGVHAASQDEHPNATNAPRDVQLAASLRRAPSPLNGERAGVRGEKSEERFHFTVTSSLPAVAAGAAGLLALVAGVFVFAHQRKLLAGYAQAERLAAERQQQLGQAQAALFQSQKLEALGTLAAGVAHDFNNLLSIIRMSKQLVDRAVKPEGVTKENLEAIEQAVHQGKSLVNSMLGYSRRPTEAIEDFSVVKVVGDTVALLSRQFLGGLTLNLELDQSCPPIHGSRARLEQALLNLIVNASEAMKSSGVLTIKARPMDSSAPAADGALQSKAASAGVELSVSDTGSGIAPDVLPRIFEPFFTTKTAGAQRGTGLGLSLVYAIAKQDGWGLGVQSAPGKGATFTLLLPAGQTDFAGAACPLPQPQIIQPE